MNRAYVYVFGAVAMWSTIATATKLLVSGMETMLMLAFTCLFATIVLLAYAIWKKAFKRKFHLKEILRMILIGSLGVFFNALFYYMGTARLSAQQALLINDTWPIMTILFSGVILKEKLTPSKVIAALFSFLGIVLAVTNGNLSSFQQLNTVGVICSLAAGFCYALFSLLLKEYHFDETVFMLLAFASGAAVAFLIVFLKGSFSVPPIRQLAGLVFNGVICNAAPYFCWALAMKRGNTAVMANMIYLVPFGSLLITHFVLHEPITFFSITGLALIVLGIALQLWIDHRNSVKNA